jgi:NTP pyrophosphatase (non-canonical NTP hydrolase)
MQFNEFQSLCRRTMREEDNLERIKHAGEGFASEAGEYIDAIKKTRYGKPLDRTNLIEEVSDILFYCAMAAEGLGISLNDIAQVNVNKLRARYPEGFTARDATIRDLSAEAVAMTGVVDGR